jgi:hypothetical protein
MKNQNVHLNNTVFCVSGLDEKVSRLELELAASSELIIQLRNNNKLGTENIDRKFYLFSILYIC